MSLIVFFEIGINGITKVAAVQPNFTIKLTGVDVEGTQRIELDTVRSYLLIKPGDEITPQKLDQSLKRIFATGLFADVSLKQVGTRILVKVIENPVINRISFEGNKRIEDSVLVPEVQLKPRIVYTRSKVQDDLQRLIDIYRRSGRFGVSIEPKVIKLDQNRVDLVFEIDEGDVTKIKGIIFQGNKVYSNSELRSVIQTKESAWYRFLTSEDNYDPDRLSYDRELLRRFYLSKGYADFRVRSAVAELAPNKKGFFITFLIEEGKQYRFGEFSIKSFMKKISNTKLQKAAIFVPGEIYNAEKVEKTIEKFNEILKEQGFAFAKIRPKFKKSQTKKLIDLSFEIQEGKKVYVDRINIGGNVRTVDEVIRREVPLAEGDAFNSQTLRLARRNIRGLGFFKAVELKTGTARTQDKTVIDIEVVEQSTGELSLGAGFSSGDGLLADIGVRERNLLGLGQDLSLNFRLSGVSSQIDLKFTEPYFLNRKLSAGFDIFRTTRELTDESSFDRKSTGAAIRVGYDLTENLSQKLEYRLSSDQVTNIASNASLAVKEQEGKSSLSSLAQTLVYDTRDDKLNPRRGNLANYGLSFAGIGGSVRHLKNTFKATTYLPIGEKLVSSLTLAGGLLLPIDDEARIIDRFVLGGRSLRGFQSAGVGPRDRSSGDAVGGEWFYTASAQLKFPIGLPNEFQVEGRAFSDFGSIGKTDTSLGTIDNDSSLRGAVGFGISWQSPVGPFTIDFAKAFLKETFDKTETIRFDLGTRF